MRGHFDSLEEVHRALMEELSQRPECESAPRGRPIREMVATSFHLTDPRNRIIHSPARAANYGFAVGELCWYARGDSDLETMLYYNRRMAQFSDDGQSINSAYGARIFNPSVGGRNSQWEFCLFELKRDPDSRRAVVHINEPRDLWRAVTAGSKDVPCTLSLQFLIRDRRLHLHAVMRSNDVVWGLPYDVFSFTCLQESFLYQLQEIGVPVDDLGFYYHTAGSLHIYETHYTMAGLVSNEDWSVPAPMTPFTLDELEELSTQVEPRLRLAAPDAVLVNSFQGSAGWMFQQLLAHREKRLSEAKEKREQPT